MHGGTLVRMVLHNHTARTLKRVFDRFTSDDDYGFTKTVVPVKPMRYGDDNPSRSQAKRLLARFDRFKVVVLDFSGVASVGQAFADEVFRVFGIRHPEVDVVSIHASSEVKRMISRARALGASDGGTLKPATGDGNAAGPVRAAPAPRGGVDQPRRAASMAATSIFVIVIIAPKARLASSPPAASASVSARGVICHESPHRSLHQPQALASPPLPTMASQ
jgi:hypothetical protein